MITNKPTIVLGAMNYGTTVSEQAARELLDHFVERGGVWIDTADCYSFWNDPSGVGGQSESVLGRWLTARPGIRERVAISTKVRNQPMVPHLWPESAAGLSRGAIERGVRECLARLRTDHVDLLWAHGEDRDVELAETVETFGKLAADGVALRLGASNHPSWRVERARQLAHSMGLPGWTALQLRHSYLQPRPGSRLPDAGHQLMTPGDLDYASAEGDIAVWAYTPLLNGAYTRADRPLPEVYEHPGTTRRLELLDVLSREHGATRNQLVLAWLMAQTPGISPIVGVSSLAQLDEALAAQDLALSPDDVQRLNEAA